MGSLAAAPEGPSCKQVLGVPLLAPGGACLGALLLSVGADGLNIGVVRIGLLLAGRLASDHQGDLAGLAEALALVLPPAAHHVATSHVTASEPADSDGGSVLGGSESGAVGYSSDNDGLQVLDRDDDGRQRLAGGGNENGDDGGEHIVQPRRGQMLQQGMDWLLRFDDDSLESLFLEWHARSMFKVGFEFPGMGGLRGRVEVVGGIEHWVEHSGGSGGVQTLIWTGSCLPAHSMGIPWHLLQTKCVVLGIAAGGRHWSRGRRLHTAHVFLPALDPGLGAGQQAAWLGPGCGADTGRGTAGGAGAGAALVSDGLPA